MIRAFFSEMTFSMTGQFGLPNYHTYCRHFKCRKLALQILWFTYRKITNKPTVSSQTLIQYFYAIICEYFIWNLFMLEVVSSIQLHLVGDSRLGEKKEMLETASLPSINLLSCD